MKVSDGVTSFIIIMSYVRKLHTSMFTYVVFTKCNTQCPREQLRATLLKYILRFTPFILFCGCGS